MIASTRARRTALSRFVRLVFGALGVCLFSHADARSDAASSNAEQLLQVADFDVVSVSPDMKMIAIRVQRPSIARNRVELSWYVARVADGHLTNIGSGGDADWEPLSGIVNPAKIAWASDSRRFFFTKLVGEELAIWVASNDCCMRKLTDDAANVEDFTLSHDGTRLIYNTGRPRSEILALERSEYDSGIRIDGTVELQNDIFRNRLYRGRFTSIRRFLSGEWSSLGSTIRPAKSVDLGSGKTQPATPDEVTELVDSTSSMQLPGHPKATNLQRNGARVAFLDLEEDPAAFPHAIYRKRVQVTAPLGDVFKGVCPYSQCSGATIRGLGWSKSGNELFFITDDIVSRATLYGWNGKRLRKVLRSDGLLGVLGFGVNRVFSGMCPLTQSEAICTTAGPNQAPRLEAINLATGERRQIFDPNSTLLLPYETRSIEWRDKWGRAVSGVLVLPKRKGASRPPLVITSYLCGGLLRGGVGADVPEFSLAASGIASLCVNLNMPEVWGRPYPSQEIESGQPAHMQSTLDSWEAAVDFLDEQGLIDKTRVGISGLSFGAASVHYASMHSTKFKVAAASQPDTKSIFQYFFYAGINDDEDLRYYQMTDPLRDGMGYYDRYSVANNVSKVSIPVLVQTSEQEFRAGVPYYVEMAKERRPLEFFVFPDEAHNFMQPKHRLARNLRFLRWFEYWLLDRVLTGGGDDTEIARWNSMASIKRAGSESTSEN